MYNLQAFVVVERERRATRKIKHMNDAKCRRRVHVADVKLRMECCEQNDYRRKKEKQKM